ncbi:PREDICTED: uncharacterized protein F13E9.13, mitochondrial [Nicrophorus vespilloides]|uniref:Uncharacterized protein F13E9.13, mitochondrial n=1 Tax=Nicrophorus vespilloides TaxID=110193 RepID=A0ABM1MKD1_NICVS|nr:PREDICTED: uncharacterized protein F13E9.13, mitochondrial [Nicrophorus vespilloides]
MANRLKTLFSQKRSSVIGMVHVLPLPGTPLYVGNTQQIIDKACYETEIYVKNNIDSILVENMHDVPYVQPKNFQPETVAMMSRICTEIKKIAVNMPLGVQVLAGGNKEALAVAQASDFDYIRAEGFVFSHVADEGFTDANAGTLLRFRKQIGAESIQIFTDIKKKHSSHAVTSDVSLEETARAAEFFLSDGIILTGTATGAAASVEELKRLKQNVKLPVIIGSGITKSNYKSYLDADAFIIGSHFKIGGIWNNDLCEKTINEFMSSIKQE